MNEAALMNARTVQAWVELKGEDPEAVSALEVARARLVAGRELSTLRRVRLIELQGVLPEAGALSALLDRSTRFYNPNKERCTVCSDPGEQPPVDAGEEVVLVTERGAERRAAAERWWHHETGTHITVREGVAWVLGFAPGTEAAAAVAALTWVRAREHGLLCNPHSQVARIASGAPPRPWMSDGVGQVAGKGAS